MGLGAAVDYSLGRPGGAALRAYGISAVVRYVGTPGRAKNLTKAELIDLLGAGIDVAFVYENDTGDWLGGASAGANNARAALLDCESMGVNPPLVYLAVDSDVPGSALPIVGAYLRGAASVLGVDRVGCYGGLSATRYALNNRLAARTWGSAGWQHGEPDPRNALLQLPGGRVINGVECDVSEILSPNFGQIRCPRRRPTVSEDEMYIKCGQNPTKVAVLSGPIFVSLFSPGELQSAEDAILRQGAIVQWVEESTFQELADASARMGSSPRLVSIVAPPPPPIASPSVS